MIPLLILVSLVGFSMAVALVDWRRAWIMAVMCGVLQDPLRKLTSGSPVYMTFSVIAIYAMILLVNHRRLQNNAREFAQRFPNLATWFGLVVLFLLLAAMNGLMTYGIGFWKVPLLSLFIYLLPVPAVLVGYIYLIDEQQIYRFFRFYSVLTSIALIGSVLEYARYDSKALGMVAQVGDQIRHLPGIQIRMISGLYRAPDIMGWHAATLSSIAIAMIVRGGLGRNSWLWTLAAGWGFYNCMISGRRKAIYYVAVFAVVFFWRYLKRMKPAHIAAFLVSALVVTYVVNRVRSNEESSVYARGAATTSSEVGERLEGGLGETISQFGILGAGLGTATQGIYHLTGSATNIGWQEGGLGKLAIELGVPGLLAVVAFVMAMVRLMLRITKHPDIPESSQFSRVTLFALVVANMANFTASAQAYTDPMLVLITAFFVGCLFATATLDERAAAVAQPATSPMLAPATA
jgi:hypothetical protein